MPVANFFGRKIGKALIYVVPNFRLNNKITFLAAILDLLKGGFEIPEIRVLLKHT